MHSLQTVRTLLAIRLETCLQYGLLNCSDYRDKKAKTLEHKINQKVIVEF
jgi:hypothetical protein